MTILEQFTIKGKSAVYIGVFIELYHWKNFRQVYEIYKIIELKKIYDLTMKNLYSLDAY